LIYMDERCAQLLCKLISAEKPIKISDLALMLGVSARTIRYDLDKIDEFLRHNQLPQLSRKPNAGIKFVGSSEQKNEVLTLISNINSYNYILTPRERQNAILIELLQAENYITIEYLTEILSVSRGTIINDLRKVKVWLTRYNLKLKSSPRYGIKIEGSEKDLRKAVVALLTDNMEIEKALKIIKTPLSRQINVVMDQQIKKLFEDLDIGVIEETIRMAERQMETVFSDGAYSELVIHIALAIKRIQIGRNINIPKDELASLKFTKEFAVASRIAQKLERHFSIKIPIDEIGYITVHLLGGKVTATNTWVKENWVKLQVVTAKIIESVQSKMGVDFSADNELYKGLMEHLGPTIYRLKHDLPLKNPILDEVKENYSQIFQVVKKSLRALEEFVGSKINDEEIGFITVHFGAALERNKAKNKAVCRILVVCGTGVGTTKLLSSRIKAEFNGVEIVGSVASHRVKEMLSKNKVDLIVSTVPIPGDNVPEVLVNPLLPREDIVRIRRLIERCLPAKDVTNKMNNKTVYLEEILKIIQKHCKIGCRSGLVNDLAKYLNIPSNKGLKGVVQPLLKDLLTEKTIKLNVDAKNWEEAVRIGGDILVKNGFVEPRYVDAMVRNVKEIGPYIVIAPGIAMPHARPEDGVKQVCMSLITLKKSVEFGHSKNNPVSVVVCFGAIDNSTHLKALSQLVELLGSMRIVDKIKNVRTVDKVLALIN